MLKLIELANQTKQQTQTPTSLTYFVDRVSAAREPASTTTTGTAPKNAYEAFKQFATPNAATSSITYVGDEIPPRPYTPPPTGKVQVSLPSTQAVPGGPGLTLDQFASTIAALKNQPASTTNAYEALKQYSTPNAAKSSVTYTAEEAPPRPYTPQPTGRVPELQLSQTGQQSQQQSQQQSEQQSQQPTYYTIWYQGQPYYADPNSGIVYDAKGSDIGYRAAYNSQTGQWELRSSVGTLYVGADGTVYDASGKAVAYVDLNNPRNAIGGQGFGDYLKFMNDTGRASSIYNDPNKTTTGGTTQRTGGGATQGTGGGPTFNIPTDVYPTSSSSSTSSSWAGINWGQAPKQAQQVVSSQLDILASLYPQGQQAIQGITSGAAKALEQQAAEYADRLNRQARYALRAALQDPGLLQGVLNALAARGTLDSSVASDALAQATQQAIAQGARAAYEAASEGAKAQMQATQAGAGLQLEGQRLLNDLAKIGPAGIAALLDLYKQATSSASSTSYSADPLAPYRLMVEMFGMMQ